ncbi:MAG: hypothetical protein KDB68_01690 [Planctomycetes bacterium]|nr:hypothetical protein [Planctomycetota bacterium]MCA8934893.1 hypothetical protein [Planctomycetota bacterium]
MARYQNVRKPANRTARPITELIDVEATTERLYLETGGMVIQMQIEALELTAEAYRSQMRGAKAAFERGHRLAEDERPGWGPTITPYEARMSANALAKLMKLREEKLAQCRTIVEEGEEARKLEAEAAETKTEPEESETKETTADETTTAENAQQETTPAAEEPTGNPATSEPETLHTIYAS